MRTNHKDPSQLENLIEWLMLGLGINRVVAFRQLGIADIRSRMSEADKFFGFKVPRERVPGKKYLNYQLYSKTTARS